MYSCYSSKFRVNSKKQAHGCIEAAAKLYAYVHVKALQIQSKQTSCHHHNALTLDQQCCVKERRAKLTSDGAVVLEGRQPLQFGHSPHAFVVKVKLYQSVQKHFSCPPGALCGRPVGPQAEPWSCIG